MRNIVIVIPTRNRANLAQMAILSVIKQSEQLKAKDISVSACLSDNSTDPRQRSALASFCSRFPSHLIDYRVPPEPLAMTAHWDWILRQVLGRSEVTHMSILTDRMCLKAGALQHIARSLTDDNVLVYNCDTVVDERPPFSVYLAPWNRRLLTLRCDAMIRMASLCCFPGWLPRMLNCIVPRPIIERILKNTGRCFDSISPDFNFCFNILASEKTYLYLNRSLLFQHGLSRSNGHAGFYGRKNQDFNDFMKNFSGMKDAILPSIFSVGNGIANEYEHARRRFPEILPQLDRARYLRMLLDDFARWPESEERSAFEREIFNFAAQQCIQPWEAKPNPRPGTNWLREVKNKIRYKVGQILTSHRLRAILNLYRERFDEGLVHQNSYRFDDLSDALDFASKILPRSSTRTLAQTLEPGNPPVGWVQ